jgi:ribonuclease HII
MIKFNGKEFDHILVDGNYFKPYKEIPHTCVIKGDNTYYSIAAASILAKVSRDEYMIELHNEFPEYGWGSNKGYGSVKHIEAIKNIGINEHHRTSFLKNIL